MLAPILFNIYTNDQPTNAHTRQFIYADDTAGATQGRAFNEVEDKLIRVLDKIAVYYKINYLKPNINKTLLCFPEIRKQTGS